MPAATKRYTTPSKESLKKHKKNIESLVKCLRYKIMLLYFHLYITRKKHFHIHKFTFKNSPVIQQNYDYCIWYTIMNFVKYSGKTQVRHNWLYPIQTASSSSWHACIRQNLKSRYLKLRLHLRTESSFLIEFKLWLTCCSGVRKKSLKWTELFKKCATGVTLYWKLSYNSEL